MKTEDEYIVVYCTCPDEQSSKKIASLIITHKAAACVSILPNIISTYTWNDAIETSTENLLMMKTLRSSFSLLEEIINDNHPYDCPELIATTITHGSIDYLNWINTQVREKCTD